MPRFLAKPAMLLPVLLASALLVVAFRLGNVGHALGALRAIPLRVLVTALAMAAAYLLLKAWQLRLLLANLGLHPDRRRFLLAFSVGELLVTLPLGIFAQNWILSATGRARFATSSAATVLMLVLETLVTLLLLAAVGIPHWPAVQPLAALLATGVALTGVAVVRFANTAERLARKAPPSSRLHLALAQAVMLLNGLKKLSSWRTLALNIVLAAAYLGALAFAFMAVGAGVGVGRLDYLTAATIYALSLAAVLVCGGLVSHVGAVEVLGMEAAHALGISLPDGLALMLGFRIVWTGAIWLLTLPIVLLSWRKAFHPQEIAHESAYDLEEAPH